MCVGLGCHLVLPPTRSVIHTFGKKKTKKKNKTVPAEKKCWKKMQIYRVLSISAKVSILGILSFKSPSADPMI